MCLLCFENLTECWKVQPFLDDVFHSEEMMGVLLGLNLELSKANLLHLDLKILWVYLMALTLEKNLENWLGTQSVVWRDVV